MGDNIAGIKERIRKCLVYKNWTQVEAVDQMEKCGYKVSRQTFSKWCNPDTGNVPETPALRCLAKIFDCDVSYLLCDIDEKRIKDIEIKKYTGLSQKAVDALNFYAGCTPDRLAVIDRLICNPSLLLHISDVINRDYSMEGYEIDRKDPKTGAICKMTIDGELLKNIDVQNLYIVLQDYIERERAKKQDL